MAQVKSDASGIVQPISWQRYEHCSVLPGKTARDTCASSYSISSGQVVGQLPLDQTLLSSSLADYPLPAPVPKSYN